MKSSQSKWSRCWRFCVVGLGMVGSTACANANEPQRQPPTREPDPGPDEGVVTTMLTYDGDCIDGLRTVHQERGRFQSLELLDDRYLVGVAPDQLQLLKLVREGGETGVARRDLAASVLGYREDQSLWSASSFGTSLALVGSLVFEAERMVVTEVSDASFEQGSLPATELDCETEDCRDVLLGDQRLAMRDSNAVVLYRREADDWQRTGRYETESRVARPLLWHGDELWVAFTQEASKASRFAPAALIELDASGTVLSAYETIGNPRPPHYLDEGLLIPEANSYWGNLQAAIEWVDWETRELRKLTDVEVISSGDGTDGALDLEFFGGNLYVANCESGLARSEWSTEALKLQHVAGPWDDPGIDCRVSVLALLDSLLVIGGESTLYFVEACE